VQDLLSPDYLNLENVVADYRRRAVLAIQSAFLFGTGIIFVQGIGQSGTTILIAIGLSIVLSTISLVSAYHEHNRFAVIILATQFLLAPTYLAYLSFGTFDSAMMILPAGMIAISVVVKPRVMAIFSVLMLVATGFIAMATLQGTVGKPYFHAEVSSNPVDVIVTLVIVFFSGVVATYVSSVLSTLLQRLAEYQSTLEKRVERRTCDLEQSNEELHLAMERLDQARVELVRGEKLAGLGSLVAGVAHELNTPIGNTAMVASTLQDQVTTFSKIIASGKLRKSDLNLMIDRMNEGTELLIRSTHRARDLVASFKQVAVDQTSERRREFHLMEVVDDVLSTMRPSFSGINISSQVQPGIACDGYPGPLGQLLTNLIQNSIIHGIGQASDGLVSVLCQTVCGNQMEIVVQDNGQGMTTETMNKIFDPFFTSRLGQGGSGLGLTIVHNLATGILGGKIAVESTIGVGTRFIVKLPQITP
jgi:signal transduction histidine kinase